MVIVLWSSSAWALAMEYYTYGGFDPVMQAFNRLALIFSDANYNYLFTAFVVYGVIGGAIGGLNAAATTGRLLQLGWIVKLIAGVVVMAGLLFPKGSLTIYDPVLNRFQTLGNIPDGIVAIAGTLNLVERSIVDVVDTASITSKYTDAAGGLGYKIEKSLKDAHPHDSYLRSSLIRYTKDCVSFELMRSGTSLTLDGMRNSTTDLIADLAQGSNMAVYTVYYDAAAPEGSGETCAAAWTSLHAQLINTSTYTPAVSKLCGDSFFDPSNAAEMARCNSLVSNTSQAMLGSAISAVDLIKYRQVSEVLYNLYYQDDTELATLYEASRNLVASGMGMGITMNEWIPIIKAVLTSVVVGLLPFLALLFPTPLLGKALGTILGFFVFLTTWGITDAVVHGAAIDYAYYAFEGARQTTGMGVYTMGSLPSTSNEILAMFGVIRGTGMMLAGLISSMLVKFGGSMLAHLAGNLSSLVQGAGAKGGSLFTPEGRADAMQRQSRAAGLLDAMPQHKFANLAGAEAWGTHNQVGRHDAAQNFRNSLIDKGVMTRDEGMRDLARSMQGSNMTAVTSKGTLSSDVNGRTGEAVMNRDGFMTSDGRSGSRTTNQDGLGHQSFTGGTGGGSGTYDPVNGYVPYEMKTKGMGDLSNSLQGMERKNYATIHSWAQSEGFSDVWNMAKQAQSGDSTARAWMANHTRNQHNAISESLNDSSSKLSQMTTNEREAVNSALNMGGTFSVAPPGGKGKVAGAGASLGASGTETFTYETGDGKTHSLTMGQSSAQAFTDALNIANQKSASDTITNSNMNQFLSGRNVQIGETDVMSFAGQVNELRQASSSIKMNGELPYIADRASRVYGSTSEEALNRTQDDISKLVASGPRGQQSLTKDIEGYFKRESSWNGLSDVDPTAYQSGIGKNMTPTQGVVDNATKNPVRTEPLHVLPDGGRILEEHGGLTGEQIKSRSIQQNIDNKQQIINHQNGSTDHRMDTGEKEVLGKVYDRSMRPVHRTAEAAEEIYNAGRKFMYPADSPNYNPSMPVDQKKNNNPLSQSNHHNLGPYEDHSSKADPALYAYAQESARRHGVDFDLVNRLISAESHWNPNAVSPKKAVGLGQLMPDTAVDMGVNRNDPKENIDGSIKYLKQQLEKYNGDPVLAFAAYNAGPGRVDKAGGRVPNIHQTKEYVERTTGLPQS